jgi:hypothetical protein
MGKTRKIVGVLVPTEHEEQTRFFRELQLRLKQKPVLGLAYAIPNGTRTSINVARRMKAEGVKAGVPDVHFPVGRGGYLSLYIEFKARPCRHPDTGRLVRQSLSAGQRHWKAALEQQGHKVIVSEGWQQALQALLEYLSWP